MFLDRIACHADNGYGTPMQSMRTIDIIRKPEVSVPPRKVPAIEGEQLSFSCEIDGFPTPTIAVGRNGASLQNSARTHISITNDREVRKLTNKNILILYQ